MLWVGCILSARFRVWEVGRDGMQVWHLCPCCVMDVRIKHVMHLTGAACLVMLQVQESGAFDGSAVAASAAYLRDRVGVPRDLKLPAARQLRAHLNWLIDTVQQQQPKAA